MNHPIQWSGGEAPSCALSPADLAERLQEWREVAGHALERRAGPGWIVTSYPRTVLGKLHRLIQAEAECCSFLEFDVRELGVTVEVEARFPPGFEPMISAVNESAR